MEVLILVVIVGAIVGGVIWNHQSTNMAFSGVEFELPAAPEQVRAAIEALYVTGAKAKGRAALTPVKVRPSRSGFDLASKVGDEGEISLSPSPTGGTVVSASASRLFIGNPMHTGGSGLWAAGTGLGHMMAKTLGIRPTARRWKGFLHGLDSRIQRQLQRAQGTR